MYKDYKKMGISKVLVSFIYILCLHNVIRLQGVMSDSKSSLCHYIKYT